MRNAAGQIVGIRLRLDSGRKLAVRGGKEGLFVPSDLKPRGRLMIGEGPTDTAALLDLGFQAVGRPSCSGGVRHAVALLQRLQPAEVVVVADADEPGQRGAEALAGRLLAYVPAARLITPPPGMKDARQWKLNGATWAEVQATIDAAPVWRLKVTTEAKDRKLCKAQAI